MTVREHRAESGVGFEVRVQPAREMVWVVPVGELDLATAPRLREEVQELIAVGFAQVIIDLRDLSFIDSTGLRLLLGLVSEAEQDGWQLSLVQGPDKVQRLFAMTGVLERLPFMSVAALTR
jgi:anti-anti-sigma factor